MARPLLSRARRGSNLIEFALCSPVLILVLFGIIEYGSMFNRMLSVQSATRDGARWGATPNFDIETAPAAAVAHVRESLSLLGMSCSEADEAAGGCEITAEADELEGLLAITVRTELVYESVCGGLLPIPDTLNAMTSFVLVDQVDPDDE
jgi:hypothetical protein